MTDEELMRGLRAANELSLQYRRQVCDEAIDRLQSLLTQNQKMREALEGYDKLSLVITSAIYRSESNFGDRVTQAVLDARAALGATPADEAEPLPKATI